MNKLEASYSKQKAIFDKAKSKKMANISKQAGEIEKKIRKLKKHYDDLSTAYYTKEKEEFLPYPEYVAAATIQSSVSRESRSPDLSHLDEETRAIVLEGLAKRNL